MVKNNDIVWKYVGAWTSSYSQTRSSLPTQTVTGKEVVSLRKYFLWVLIIKRIIKNIFGNWISKEGKGDHEYIQYSNSVYKIENPVFSSEWWGLCLWYIQEFASI